jgi:hypothetical protein
MTVKEKSIVRWPRLLDIDTAAEYLSIAPRTLRNRLGRKVEDPFPVKPKRFGRKVLFDIRDLDRYVDSMPYETYANDG